MGTVALQQGAPIASSSGHATGMVSPPDLLVAQIEFTEWTPDGHLMHAAFIGLRQDKSAHEVVREPA